MDHPSRSHEQTTDSWKAEFLVEARTFAQHAAYGFLDEQDAEDVAQDVVLYLLNRLRVGRMQRPPRHWKSIVRKIVRHRVLNLRRRRIVHRTNARELTEILKSVCSEWMNPEAVCDARELDRIRRRTMRRLSPRCRDVFVMVRQDDASYKVAAGHFGITPLAVCAHVVAAQRIFRSELAASGFAPPPKRDMRNKTGRGR